MRAWRITEAQYAKTKNSVNGVITYPALDGVGASLFPGRWNVKGSKVFYAAQSESLAIVEVLAHLESNHPLNQFRLISIEFDDQYMKPFVPDSIELERDWNSPKQQPITQHYGERYREQYLAVQVPSIISGSEFSYVFNPYHEKFPTVKIGEAEEFSFDPRLME